MTLSNTDTELFELCKQVYEATKFDDFHLRQRWVLTPVKRRGQDDYSEWKLVDIGYPGKTAVGHVPLYTSDYLLEKLQGFDVDLYYTNTWRLWVATAHDDIQGKDADTPLKSLLKLTLALHKESLL